MWFGLFYKEGAGVLQTNWFIASVITEIVLLFSIRSMLPIRKSRVASSLIIWLSVFAFSAAVTLPIIPATAHYFEFTTPSWSNLGLIISYFYLSDCNRSSKTAGR